MGIAQNTSFMTALMVLPSILLYDGLCRIIIVLSILRQTQQTPPNQILVALALFITLFVMAPTFDGIYQNAYKPYSQKAINLEEALDRASSDIKKFMTRNTREKDLLAFADMNGSPKFENETSVPWSVLLPAFITSGLKTAFQIGF